MKLVEESNTEAYVAEMLDRILNKLGFNVEYMRRTAPDFIAQKRIDGSDYKIGIELKQNTNVDQAVRNGIATLKEADVNNGFNKLLLLIVNRITSKKENILLNAYQQDNPTNLEIISIDDLEKWSESLSKELLTSEEKETFYFIRQLCKELIKLVGKNPEELKKLEWRDLERVIAELFKGIGFKVTLTPGSKDGGKDVILECTIDKFKKSYIVEIKHWRSEQKVRGDAVKEFTKVVINEKRQGGLFLSTYGFSNNYYESLSETEKSLVRFGEKEKIVDLCRTYEKVNNGIWNPIETLEDVLFKGTLSL